MLVYPWTDRRKDTVVYVGVSSILPTPGSSRSVLVVASQSIIRQVLSPRV